jgi:hypothetical protein
MCVTEADVFNRKLPKWVQVLLLLLRLTDRNKKRKNFLPPMDKDRGPLMAASELVFKTWKLIG